MGPSGGNIVNQILYALLWVLNMSARILSAILVLHAILSWFVSPFNKFQQFLGKITGPLCAPFRPLTDKLLRGGLPLDLSPLAALLMLGLVQRLCLWGMAYVI